MVPSPPPTQLPSAGKLTPHDLQRNFITGRVPRSKSSLLYNAKTAIVQVENRCTWKKVVPHRVLLEFRSGEIYRGKKMMPAISAEPLNKRSWLRLTSAPCCITDNAVSFTQALFMRWNSDSMTPRPVPLSPQNSFQSLIQERMSRQPWPKLWQCQTFYLCTSYLKHTKSNNEKNIAIKLLKYKTIAFNFMLPTLK